MKDILSLDTRRNIFHCIQKNPGITLTELANQLNLSIQLIDYHILFLKQHELISMTKEQKFKRCYIKGSIGVEEKKLLSILRQEIPLKIVMFLLQHPYRRHVEIRRFLCMSSPRFSYHLRKLVQNHIVKEDHTDCASGYVVENKEKIIQLLIQYQPAYLATLVDEAWKDFGPSRKSKK